MKKTPLILLCALALLLCLTGCRRSDGPDNSETNDRETETGTKTDDPYDIMGEDPYGIRNEGGFNVFYSVKTAYKVFDDGWVFGFIHNIEKTGDQSHIIRYHFYGINLRHRYDENYIGIHVDTTDEGTQIRYREIPASLGWETGTDAQRRDMAKVKEILSNDRDPEDLLALDPADFEFEELDKDLFFELLHAALEGDVIQEGTDFIMWEKPGNEFLSEQRFLDGYKFQVAFLMKSGNLLELFIDVLYPTGPGYADYVQLYDLVKNGTATPEQAELYSLICSIEERAKAENCFSAGTDEYRNTVLDGVELARLAAFLESVQNNTYYITYRQDSIYERID